jgi:metal transporter CNNM
MLPQALDYFQTGRAHLLLITENPGAARGALGIVSCKSGLTTNEARSELISSLLILITQWRTWSKSESWAPDRFCIKLDKLIVNVLNRIIGEEIIDETDRYMDNQSKKAAKRQGTAAVMRQSPGRLKWSGNEDLC